MIDLATAEATIRACLARMEQEMNAFGSAWSEDRKELHLVITGVQAYEFGWAFFYDTKEAVETGELGFRLAGNGPLLVDRGDGKVYRTGSTVPVEAYIEDFRRGVRRPF